MPWAIRGVVLSIQHHAATQSQCKVNRYNSSGFPSCQYYLFVKSFFRYSFHSYSHFKTPLSFCRLRSRCISFHSFPFLLPLWPQRHPIQSQASIPSSPTISQELQSTPPNGNSTLQLPPTGNKRHTQTRQATALFPLQSH